MTTKKTNKPDPRNKQVAKIFKDVWPVRDYQKNLEGFILDNKVKEIILIDKERLNHNYYILIAYK